MPKAMTFFGMAIAGLFALVFGLDLALRIPFQRVNVLIDIGFLLCAGVLGYLSWSTFREL